MKQRLKRLLSRRQKRYITDPGRSPAAVLLPIYKKQEQYHILFIKRTEKVKEHKGQISFPGGNFEPADKTLLVTALRECAEEIGLQAEDIEVLGELDDELTITSNYIVTPFAGFISWPYQFKLNEYEVEEIIEIPVSALTSTGCCHRETETLDGEDADSYVYHYQGRVIWGATARILNKFMDIWKQVPPDG